MEVALSVFGVGVVIAIVVGLGFRQRAVAQATRQGKPSSSKGRLLSSTASDDAGDEVGMVAIRRKQAVVSRSEEEAPLRDTRSPSDKNENLNPMLDEEAATRTQTSQPSAPTEPQWAQTPVAPSTPTPSPAARGMLSSMISAPSKPQAAARGSRE